MYLLTNHGTLLAAREDGSFCQIDRGGDRSSAVQLRHLSHGLQFSRGPFAGMTLGLHQGGLSLQRDGLFLCAEEDRIHAWINRPVRGPWESFQLVP